jgi:hypothetical protein
MTSAQGLIQTALELLGVYAPGETMSAADAARGLQVLNAMMDQWSNDALFCYAILEQQCPLVVGQNQYTVGPGGNVNGPRPLKLIEGPVAAYIMDANANRYPVAVIAQDRWNAIGLLTNTSNIPDTLFYDPQYPLGILNVFPTPNQGNTLYFDSYLQLSDFANLTSTMSLPTGYESAIYHNLAIALKPFFTATQLDPVVIQLASNAKASIKRTNMRPNIANYDAEIVSRASPTYNIYRDSTAGR